MQHESVIIAGAGPIGLACAISAKRRGIDPVVIDAGALTNSIVHYPINMTFFTTPERLEIGNHPLVCAGAKATREEALKYYRGVARADRKSTRLNSSHVSISYAVFCLKKKNKLNTLNKSIAYQPLSWKAASPLWRRVLALFPGTHLSPKAIIAIPHVTS